MSLTLIIYSILVDIQGEFLIEKIAQMPCTECQRQSNELKEEVNTSTTFHKQFEAWAAAATTFVDVL